MSRLPVLSPASERVLLFDGVCNLCNGFVNFVIDRDPERLFRFAALQSRAGEGFSRKYSFSGDALRTLILVENGRVYQKSTAVLRMCRSLSGVWPVFYAFIIVPRFLRDAAYDLVAANRYRWFGRRETCRVPAAADKERFFGEFAG